MIDAKVSSPLAFRLFRAMWIATTVSNFGGLIQLVGTSWMMASLGQSPQMIAFVQTSANLPLMLFSLWAGAVADNLDRRKIMLGAQAFLFATSVLLTGLAYADWLTPWSLLFFTFLIGAGTAINNPAWQASVGDMVPRASVPGAVALNSVGLNLARSLGPTIGGAIVAVAGGAATFLCNALSYLWLIVILARWRPDLPSRPLPPERIGEAMGAGIRYVIMAPPLRLVVGRTLLFGIAASALPALMPLVARDILSGGPLVYGVLLGMFGAGAVAGSILGGPLRSRFPVEWLMRLALSACACGAIVSALSANIALSGISLILAGIGWVVTLSTLNISVQMASPRWVIGRALAVYQMAAFGGMAAGSSLFGLLADHFGVAAGLISAGLLLVAALLPGLRWPLPNVSNANLDPLDQWREPATTIELGHGGGPIVITIEHRVATGNVAAFYKAMHEMRRIRRRDGARHWRIMRDTADERLWIEQFHVPTWLDYLRHNQRRTVADAATVARIRGLCAEDSDPVVHRWLERPGPLLRTPDSRIDAMRDPGSPPLV